MNLIDDFSILVWGEKTNNKVSQKSNDICDYILSNTNCKDFENLFCESSAIVLCTGRYNFDKFCELKSFQDMAIFLSNQQCHEIPQIKALHMGILKALNHLGTNYAKKITSHTNVLFNNKIINQDQKDKIISLLKLVKQEKSKREKTKQNHKYIATKKPKEFKEYVLFFENVVDSFLAINESIHLKNRANELKQKLKSQTFSIGITGVMNAGKSTMLNALLGKEILGTSVVPETANLTIIKHSLKPYAKVNFWSKKEWEQIEKSAKYMPQIDQFVKESKSHFKDSLDEYITETGKHIQIKTDQLSMFTSAKHSNHKCNLVKSVELYEDLDFVKDGVNIVDTPGLDDPVIQREEITKKYLSDCDVMIHLMNVNQSATQKDVDFIIDSLTYGHISRLLVVITRIDTVSEDELQEVINYTKKSIKQRLIDENKEAKFDSIISKIDFLPIAGKLALMHRIGKEKEALEAGYDLERSGILQIESYLKEVLFGGENEKNRLFLQSGKKEIDIILQSEQKSFMDEKKSLNKSSDELEDELKKTREENLKNQQTIQKIQSQIDEAKVSLTNYFKTLENFINGKLSSLKSVTTQRVCDDVSYEWRKNKKKPKNERIKSIIETTMKDGVVDTIRDYRYEFSKRMENELKQISDMDKNLFSGEQREIFNAKEYFEQNFGANFLNGSYAVTNERVFQALTEVKKGNVESFSVKLDDIFKETIENLSNTIFSSLKEINQHLLDGFIQKASKPTNDLKEFMGEKEERLKSQISLLKSGQEKAKIRLLELDEKIITLNEIQKSIKESAI